MAIMWKDETMEANTTSAVVCHAVGCRRCVYQGGFCSDHWEPPPPLETCGHQPVIVCGCCGREVCAGCYGAWNDLACGACRDRARGRVS
jgi:hypothetical protein